MTREANDTVSAYTCVHLSEVSRWLWLPDKERPQVCIRLPSSRRPQQWDDWSARPLRPPTGRMAVGRKTRSSSRTKFGKRHRLWNVFMSSEHRNCFCPYLWTTKNGRKWRIFWDLCGKFFEKDIEPGRSDPLLHHLSLGCVERDAQVDPHAVQVKSDLFRRVTTEVTREEQQKWNYLYNQSSYRAMTWKVIRESASGGTASLLDKVCQHWSQRRRRAWMIINFHRKIATVHENWNRDALRS